MCRSVRVTLFLLPIHQLLHDCDLQLPSAQANARRLSNTAVIALQLESDSV